MSESNTAHLTIASPEEMRALGQKLGRALLAAMDRPECVAIEGELGAGKTTLVAGVLSAAGVTGPVRSPTYTLIEPYEVAGGTIYHMDLYRLTDPEEMEPLGVRDLLVPGSVLLIEWPSRGGARVPTPDLAIEIGYLPPPGQGREVRMTASTPHGTGILARLLL